MANIDKIRAPYGFVPLNQEVVLPEWGEAATHDRPFEDGVCGRFELEIEALSPVFVRGAHDAQRFFRTPDGLPAIPGTSLRGMLRNVVEIASFGKLDRVNDHRFAMRDLHNHKAYVQHMARIVDVGGKKQPVPLVEAGWLVPERRDDPTEEGDADPIVAWLHPCHFAKLEYGILGKIVERVFEAKGFDPGQKQAAVDKYKRLRAARPPRGGDEDAPAWGWAVGLRIDPLRRVVPRRRFLSEYGKVVGPGNTRSWLVMTGQPSRYVPGEIKGGRGAGKPKHHDFVFHGRAGDPIPVRRSQFEAFEFVHSDRGQQNRLNGRFEPNPEWAYWRREVWESDAEDTRGVPVFFLRDERAELTAFGLAMMFRLPAQTSVRAAIRRFQRQAEAWEPDFAETLFGRVPLDDARQRDERDVALRGRVSVGLAPAIGSAREAKAKTVVLSAPKASYYPNYLEQDRQRPGGPPPRDAKNKPDYATWMDRDAIPRGWKRYRPIEGNQTIDPPVPRKGDGTPLDLKKVGTTFRPLEAGTRFVAPVRVHNVRPVELGALLWALDLGEGAMHKLGMGRPLGYGTVRLKPLGLRGGLRDSGGAPVDAAACVQAFRAYMERRVPGWEQSAQIRELRALARPVRKEDARHMQIDHSSHGNEFQQAKLQGRVLPAAAEHTARPRGERPAPAVSAPSSAPPSADPSGLPRRGERVQVRLTGTSKKGRWQGELVDGRGKGTVLGDAPAGAADGAEVTVTVVRASSRFNIELSW